MKFDMHCHTKEGSIDSRTPIKKYIELLQEQGFSGMLITDHDSYKGYEYWYTHRSEMPEDFVVLKGIEYDTKDAGHYIVIMPDNVHLPVLKTRGMSVDMLIKLVHHYGGILGPAHPFGVRSASAMFFKRVHRNPELLHEFDFLEGFNTCETVKANRLAQALARCHNLQCFGGSDSHREKYVGTAFTVFDRDVKCNDDLIAAVKDRGVAAFGGKEREFLRKHKARNAFYATCSFKAYNRSLSFLFTPVRKHKLKSLNFHHHSA